MISEKVTNFSTSDLTTNVMDATGGKLMFDIAGRLQDFNTDMGIIRQQLRTKQKLRLRLLEKASQGAEEGELVTLLAELSQCPVLLYDQFLFCLAGDVPSDGSKSDLAGWKDAIATNKLLCGQIVEKATKGLFYLNPSKRLRELCPAWAVPIRSGRKFLGYLFILDNERVDLDPSLCQEWSAIFAMVLARHCQLWELKERLSSNFLERLLTGQIKSEEALLCGARLGLDLHKKWFFLCASPDYFTENEITCYAWLQRLPSVCQYLQDELNKQFPGNWVGFLNSDLIILVPYLERDTVSLVGKTASAVQGIIQRLFKETSFTVCTGSACFGLEDYFQAYSEVVRAIKVSLNF